jgi:hypothetical protein
MTRLIAVAVAFVLLGSLSQGKEPAGLSDAAKMAYNTIRTSKTFCATAVGIAGETPKVVEAFRIIIKQPKPETIFKALIEDATISGQLYALCGLYHSDHDHFKDAVKRYHDSEEIVETLMGCSGSINSVARIVKSSSPDVVRLKKPSQTTKQWAKATASKGMLYDIVGGGWPNAFWMRTGYETTTDEQGGARQPSTAPDSKAEGNEKPKTESEGRSQ